ncbi:MAG: hypothetical protein AABZ47_12865 [Planctomycetota bacterium]
MVVTGQVVSVNWYRIDPMRVVWIGATILAVAWIYKIITWS